MDIYPCFYKLNALKLTIMEEFRRKTISGYIVYVMYDTADPHKKMMTVTYPNGYMAKWPYEIRDFHMMPWGYVAEMDNGLDIHIENDEDVWSYLRGGTAHP